MKFAYTDTSVLLRLLLKEAHPYSGLGQFDRLVTSEILSIEVFRVLDRLRIQHRWTPEQLALRIELFQKISESFEEISLESRILAKAKGASPSPVKALDAIHLSTALLFQEQIKQDLIFLTHDEQQGVAAIACGLKVDGVTRSI